MFTSKFLNTSSSIAIFIVMLAIIFKLSKCSYQIFIKKVHLHLTLQIFTHYNLIFITKLNVSTHTLVSFGVYKAT